jgi:DNA replication protein DnaC
MPYNPENIRKTLEKAIYNNQSVKMNYINNKGEPSSRILSNIKFTSQKHIKAFCHYKNEERTFSINNITDIKLLENIPTSENIYCGYLDEDYILKIVNTAKMLNKSIEIDYPFSSSIFDKRTIIIQDYEICQKELRKYIRTSSETLYLFNNIISIKIHGKHDYSEEDEYNTDNFEDDFIENTETNNDEFITEKTNFPKEYLEIKDLIENTENNIFITGGAGTGKSTLLKYIVGHTQKNCVVLAPTGIAAINANGQTIHRFFNFPTTLFDKKSIKINNMKKELFESLQMMIIDEISMVRVDILDAVDWALRLNRRNSKPFGGVQMVFVGDVFQLPPVLTAQDNDYIFTNYKSHYFFDAPVLQETDYQLKELTKVFRQDASEREFKETLNRIRIDEATDNDIRLLNSRMINIANNDDTIYLTTRREIATGINLKKINELPAPSIKYTGMIIDTFDIGDSNKITEDKLPAPYELVLKKGAQVMLLRNDKSGRWVNGTIGIIQELKETSISVLINGKLYSVEKETWEQIEYKYNVTENKIEKQIIGKYVQYPLQLAYAITIHKSQGMTFDKINIDIGQGAFTHGQIYVALSRCKTLNGINLNSRIDETDIIVDPKVLYWYKSKTNQNYELNNHELQRASLAKMFEERLSEALDIMDKQYNYQPLGLKKMVSQLGVRNAIRKLVNSPIPPKGLRILQNKGALHLSMEALILDDRWKNLFEEIDRENARRRLLQLGFDYLNQL